MSEVKTNKISSLSTNGDITLDPNGTGDTIIASGNVGIGVTTATELNESGFRELIIGGTTEGAGITLKDADANVKMGMFTSDSSNTGVLRTITNHPLALRTNNTERMRVDNSGDITAQGEGGTANTINLRQGSMKAWHYAHTNATFYDSFNVSSASDQGTGNFDFSFTNNMNNDDYSITCNALYAELAQPEGASRTTGQYTIRIFGRQDSINNQDQYNSAQIGGDIA